MEDKHLIEQIRQSLESLKSRLDKVESKLELEKKLLNKIEDKADKLYDCTNSLKSEKLELLSNVMDIAFEGRNIPKILFKKSSN